MIIILLATARPFAKDAIESRVADRTHRWRPARAVARGRTADGMRTTSAGWQRHWLRWSTLWLTLVHAALEMTSIQECEGKHQQDQCAAGARSHGNDREGTACISCYRHKRGLRWCWERRYRLLWRRHHWRGYDDHLHPLLYNGSRSDLNAKKLACSPRRRELLTHRSDHGRGGTVCRSADLCRDGDGRLSNDQFNKAQLNIRHQSYAEP